MALTLTIAGAARTFLAESLQYEDALNGRDRLTVRIQGRLEDFTPQEGQAVLLADGATQLFGGFIQRVSVEQEGDSDFLAYDVEAEDYSGLFDRHLVARVYENQTAGAIARDVLAQDLAGEGLSNTGIDDGPTITRLPANYITAAEVMNDLAELTGMAWWVTPAKVVQFHARDALIGPAMTATNYVRLRIVTDREEYRNRQYFRGGTDLTDARTETFVGDGNRRVFNLAFPVGAAPTLIEENRNAGGWVSKTIGIRGVETGKDWYWNKELTEISQDDAGTLLATVDKLRVTYRGQFPILVVGEASDEIVARQALEGGSGVYEAREDRPDVDDATLAEETTAALLARFARTGRRLDVTTLTSGYRAGQLVQVTVPRHNLNAEFLVEGVRGADWLGQDQGSGAKLLYTLTLVEGDPIIGWRTFYRKLLDVRRTNVPRDNELLVLVRTTKDPVYCHDVLNALTAAAVTTVGSARVGFAEVG